LAEIDKVAQRVEALRARYRDRDLRHAEVRQVRKGNIESIAPELFNDQFQRPIVANLIDTAARDSAAVLAPLPSINASAASMLTEAQRKRADKRTKIVLNYVEKSRLNVQMLDAADHYNSFGLIVSCVEPDFRTFGPRITFEDPVGAYPVWDKRGETVELARIWYSDAYTLGADYETVNDWITFNKVHKNTIGQDYRIRVAKYSDRDFTVIYLPDMNNLVLEQYENIVPGQCYYTASRRPGSEPGEWRGAYDDVIWVQLARHRIQMLLMEGVEKAVRAPIALPNDVLEFPEGPDAVIHTQQGAQSVGRVNITMPNQAFGAVDQLRQEIQEGSMSPESRSGNVDASIVTGPGLQALLAGFSSQIKAGQTVIQDHLEQALAKAQALDEAAFGDMDKRIEGTDGGVPYSIRYRPSRDINGEYKVDISYGFASGLDPNRALVFLLQADGAQLLSKDSVRRRLPVGLNADEEERKIAVESVRASILAAFNATAQAIPEMAAAGGDPNVVIIQAAKFVKAIQSGASVEDAAEKALEPEAPPPAPTPEEQATTEGLPAPGQLPGAGGGTPDLNMLFAGLTNTGSPNLQAGVSRYRQVGEV